MGRNHVPERGNFTKRADVPKSKGRYDYYTCNFCTAAFDKDPSVGTPQLFLGCSYNYVRHLSKCEFYKAAAGASRLPSEDSSASSTGSANRRRRSVNKRLVFTTKSPRGSTSKCGSPKRKSHRRFTKLQKQELERRLAEFQAGNFLPDMFIERSCTIDFVELLCPGISAYLPSRRVLGGRISREHAAYCHGKQAEKLKEKQAKTGGFVNFLSDVFQNISRDYLMGCQFLLFGTSLTYALPKAGSRYDGVAIAEGMESIVMRGETEGWKIGAVITDNAGQCARARRILALRRPNMVLLFCFAHCINNIVKAVLKSSFADIAKNATAAVKCLNASFVKWLVVARDMMKDCYKTPLALFPLCETRWNSMQSCFASLLRVRTAQRTREILSGTVHAAERLQRVFDDPIFWERLTDAENVIAPLSEASYRLQRDENTLADVVLSFRNIFVGFNGTRLDCRSELVKCVEDRWRQCEQPLFMLTFLLNPATADDARKLIEHTDERKRMVEVEERVIGKGVGVEDGRMESESLKRLRAGKTAVKIATSTQMGRFAVYYYRRLIGVVEQVSRKSRDVISTHQWLPRLPTDGGGAPLVRVTLNSFSPCVPVGLGGLRSSGASRSVLWSDWGRMDGTWDCRDDNYADMLHAVVGLG